MADSRGIDFTYQTGAFGHSLMTEVVGGGCGCLDFDLDGFVDFYFCQGGNSTKKPGPDQPNDLLLRQQPDGNFVSVTDLAGVDERHFGQGVVVGDYDNDGFDDIYVTNVGKNSLFRNQGDGTFREVTDEAGVGDERWSTSAAFGDIDLDGDLDLYVCNYTIYDPFDPLPCLDDQGRRRVCHPRNVDPWPDECYINLGNGQFRPEAKARGLYGDGNKALGVVIADFDNDRLPDIYVANDTTPNFLFINEGGGHFVEKGVILGCAVNRAGAFQASMGLAVGDFDHNGFLDIYSSHYYKESNTLYQNHGPGGFEDVTALLGLHKPTLYRLGFGTVMEDLNQDGQEELFVTNGHVENYENNPLLRMKPQLFTFDGARWRDVSEESGGFFDRELVGRGVARTDYDDDGDIDLVVVHQEDRAALLQNQSQRGHWLKLRFRGRQSNRRGIGCRAVLRTGQKEMYVKELFAGGSYVCGHEPVLIFGLGEYNGPCDLTVLWPSGREQILKNVSVDQRIVVEEANANR